MSLRRTHTRSQAARSRRVMLRCARLLGHKPIAAATRKLGAPKQGKDVAAPQRRVFQWPRPLGREGVLSFELLRPDDLLVLTVEAQNLRLGQTGEGSAVLPHQDPARDAHLDLLARPPAVRRASRFRR